MPPRRTIGDYQAAGFGGLCFATNLNFMNLPMSYEQRLWSLEGNYWCIVAKIEDDKKYKDDTNIGVLIGATRLLLDQAGRDYNPLYESHATFNQKENDFRTLLCQIFGKVTELQGKCKMIERVQIEQEEIG